MENKTTWKGKYQSTDNTKKCENSYRKMKRSPEERHTQTHGNLFGYISMIPAQMSFSIRRE
jgi:hypothetical protein